MDGVPALDPLSYPGRMVGEPALLHGPQLLQMAPAGEAMGRWQVHVDGFSARTPQALDTVLQDLGEPETGKRHPVIAIGSNGAPGQLHHKLTRLRLPAVVPMTPLQVSGLGVGVSAHVGLNGYVAHSPFVDPGGVADVVLTLLDADQLCAVDASEMPRYRRVLLSGVEFPMTLPSGEKLEAAYIYVSSAGVLTEPADGEPVRPRTPVTQAMLLAELLELSARLRQLFDSPLDWVTKVRADPDLRAVVKQIFHETSWVLPQEALLRNVCDPDSDALAYGEISPLAAGRDRP